MPSDYPATLDTVARFPTDITDDTDSQAGTPRTGVKGFLAQWLDDVSDALVKLETELGIAPRGSYADVVTRLNSLAGSRSVRVASTANVTLPPGVPSLDVDGVTLVNGDRVLLKDQTAPAQNGVYFTYGVGTAVQLDRTVDADSDTEIADIIVNVDVGAINAESQWANTTSLPITMGTTAQRFTRVYPPHPPYIRDFWQVGATPPLAANMDRQSAAFSGAQTAITALTSLHGGMILRAGTTYSNINSFCTAVGSGSVTLNHYSIVRQSDRAVLQRTANSTSLPGLGVYARALQAPLVVDVDTPVWIAWSTQVATTSPAFACLDVLTALVQPLGFQLPATRGNTSTVPTSTPHVVGAVLAAPTTATSRHVYFWLT